MVVSPTNRNLCHDDQSMAAKRLITNGSKARQAMEILKDATSTGVSDTRERLIKMKELPQMMPNTMSCTQLAHPISFFEFIVPKIVQFQQVLAHPYFQLRFDRC